VKKIYLWLNRHKNIRSVGLLEEEDDMTEGRKVRLDEWMMERVMGFRGILVSSRDLSTQRV
jgi:hypothetical protein